MNSDYIKEELSLLLKDKLIIDYKVLENMINDEDFEVSEVKKIFITTLEKNKLEISINDSYCYRLDAINGKIIEEKDNNPNDLYEDLSNLINHHSSNFRSRFNQILKDKLSKLQDDDDD